jgi:hypothetical protein
MEGKKGKLSMWVWILMGGRRVNREMKVRESS